MDERQTKEEDNIENAIPANKKKISIKKFSDLEGKFLLVKVGSKEEPATDEQITNIQKKLEKFLEDNNVSCLMFVTHHAVNMEIITNKNYTGE